MSGLRGPLDTPGLPVSGVLLHRQHPYLILARRLRGDDLEKLPADTLAVCANPVPPPRELVHDLDSMRVSELASLKGEARAAKVSPHALALTALCLSSEHAGAGMGLFVCLFGAPRNVWVVVRLAEDWVASTLKTHGT